jgi:hypothetical protein
MKLNGWRRLAVVLCGVWCFGATSLAIYEAFTHCDGYFVGLKLPTGTVVSGDKATLPDGRVIDLDMSIDGKAVKPWEIKWDSQPEVPTEQFLRWSKLFTQGIVIPLGPWACFAILVMVGNWVVRGFREQKAL